MCDARNRRNHPPGFRDAITVSGAIAGLKSIRAALANPVDSLRYE